LRVKQSSFSLGAAEIELVRPHARRTLCSIAGIGCFRWLLRPPATRAAVTCSGRYSHLWQRGEDPRANASGSDCSRPKFAHQPGKQDLFDRRCESRGASCLPYAAQPTVERIPNIQTRRRRMARPRTRGRRFNSISLKSNQLMILHPATCVTPAMKSTLLLQCNWVDYLVLVRQADVQSRML